MSDYGPARWPGKKSVRAVETRGGAFAAPAPPAHSNEIDATDAAKALAAEHNVDLANVTGTGSEGRITKDDVSAVIGDDPDDTDDDEHVTDSD